jgi:hypothetical protein
MQALKIEERVMRHKPKILDSLMPRQQHAELGAE